MKNTELRRIYKLIRKISMDLNHKIIDAYEKNDDLYYAAEVLGYLDEESKSIVFEDDSSVEYLFDYLIYEFNKKRTKLIDRFYNDKNIRDSLTPIEIEILESYHNSKFSFFEIHDLRRSESQVILMDLLDCDNYVKIFDIGLSKSISEPFLMFARVISIDDFKYLSGIVLPFKIEYKNKILNSISMLKLKKNKVLNSTDLFILANKLNKEFGTQFKSKAVK